MAKRSFNVLVASDASPQARAGVAATLAFPWPDGTRAQGVMVSGVAGLNRWRRGARAAYVPWLRQEAARLGVRLNLPDCTGGERAMTHSPVEQHG